MNHQFIKRALAAVFMSLPLVLSAYEKSWEIRLDNPMKCDRADYPVSLNINDLARGQKITCAMLTDGSDEIPTQLDDLDGDGVADEVAFVVDVPSKGSRNLVLTLNDTGVQADYTPRVWAGFMLVGRKKGLTVDVTEITVPGTTEFYNMVHGHGPMFESELVGYRVYFNQKQTLDPYGKKTPRLELADTKFYPTDEQLANGCGDDVLLAGNSCGIGAFKGFDGAKATHIEPVKTRCERVVATGPVRTIVDVDVRGWEYDGQPVDMLNRYILYAGHRDLQIDVELSDNAAGKQFATGVQRVMGNSTESYSDHKGLVGSWGTHYPVTDTVKYAKETIGIATCIPSKYVKKECEDADNFLYVVEPEKGRMTYHTMFTALKENNGYDTAEKWFAYLPEWKKQLTTPVKVTVKPVKR